jgi:uncharacterized protein YndB with AHSA1/START domain
MEMYHFVTEWFFAVPIERVWEETANIEAYPTWWKNLKKAKIRGPESKLQLGSIADCEVKGALPFSLRFTVEVTTFEPPHLVEIKSTGNLEGTGKWVLESKGNGTQSMFYWDVGTTNPILNFLAKIPFAKPILEKSHDDVMAKGYEVIKARIEG